MIRGIIERKMPKKSLKINRLASPRTFAAAIPKNEIN